jgi:hypothetical protein
MFQVILNKVFRCGHRHVTRPITPRGGSQAYVACLDCGKHLHYDLATMQIGALIESGRPGRTAANPTHP